MGCICAKGFITSDNNGKNNDLRLSKSSKRYVASLRRDEVVVEAEGGTNDATARLISSPLEHENVGEKKAGVHGKPVKSNQRRAATMDLGVSGGPVQVPPNITRVGSVPHAEKGAQIVAGWPSWLTAVAGEAINGWVPRRADSFEKLEKIGQGTYSSVYRARDLETNKIVALKKVRFANMDPESVRFMAREILILRRLDHPNVMKLEGLITSRVSGSLYLIFEYMEHDLAGLAANPGIKFTEAQIKCYMQQLLHGLEHCHSHGVLHRDIKGSNLLIDNNGILKIGDFGLATFFRQNQKQPLTSRVVTLWYRPPELLLGSTDYGVSVDLWSSGCILAELFAGKPIMPGRTEVEQLHKIFKLCGSPSEEYWKKSKLPHSTIFKPQQPYKRCLAETYKDFPPSALALLDVLLAIEPQNRGTASSALQNEFFTTKPLPCDPSSLPKYPPSKEFDAKLRDEEARRRKAAAVKGRGTESTRKGIRESRAVPAPDANAELQISIQKRKGQSNAVSTSEKYNNEEDGGSGFPIEPSRGVAQNASSYSSQSMLSNNIGSRMTNVNEDEALIIPEGAFDLSQNGIDMKTQGTYMHRGASELSRFSNSVAVRGSSHYDGITETDGNSHWQDESFNGKYNRLNGKKYSGKHDWSLLDEANSSYKKGVEHSKKEYAASYSSKKNRIHYSGPLLPPGGNLDEMLKEHEKQIQHAVRKARLDKAKTKRDVTDTGQMESLLHYGRSGR